MLSVFPDLLSYQIISPLLIRLTLASVLIFWSYKTLFRSKPTINEKITSLIEGISGILLLIGLSTQVVSLIIIIDLVIRLVQKFKSKALLSDGVNYYILLLILAISLLLTGPGLFAFDMPL